MSKLRVGVVGAGIGGTHLGGYQKLPETVEVVALCDSNPTRLEEVADRFNVPLRYTSAEELFASGKIDVVSICLPNSLHVPMSIMALEAGLHVLCEKPLAESATSARKMVAAVAEAKTKFMVCYNRRYRADILWIKQILQEGVLGQIYQVKTGWTRETGIPGWGGWFTNKEVAGGGPLIDLGVHMLDAAMWLLDYPTPQTISGAVYANFGPRQAKTWRSAGNNNPPPYSVEDAATAFIRLDKGITLNLEASWASHARPKMDDFYITLMGTAGTVELYVANYTGEDTLTLYTEVGGAPVITKPAIKTEGYDHAAGIAEFIRCITDDLPVTATAEQGLVSMRIIEAIYQSAEAGREMTFN